MLSTRSEIYLNLHAKRAENLMLPEGKSEAIRVYWYRIACALFDLLRVAWKNFKPLLSMCLLGFPAAGFLANYTFALKLS